MAQVSKNFNKLSPAEKSCVTDTACHMAMIDITARYDSPIESKSTKSGTQTKDGKTQGN